VAHDKVVLGHEIMNRCLDFTVWADETIEGLPKCLASLNGCRDFGRWTMQSSVHISPISLSLLLSIISEK